MHFMEFEIENRTFVLRTRDVGIKMSTPRHLAQTASTAKMKARGRARAPAGARGRARARPRGALE